MELHSERLKIAQLENRLAQGELFISYRIRFMARRSLSNFIINPSLNISLNLFLSNSANVGLLDDTRDTLSTLVSEGMDRVRDEIANQIGIEVRAEMVRQTDQLMTDLSLLHGVKTTAELCLEGVNSNTEYTNEMAEAIAASGSDICEKLDGINHGLMTKLDGISGELAGSKTHQESLSQARTQISAMTALLSENLKVRRVCVCVCVCGV